MHLAIFEQPGENDFFSKPLFLYLTHPAERRLIGPSAESGAPLGSGGDELIDVEIPNAEEIRLPTVGFRQPPAMGETPEIIPAWSLLRPLE